jgi:hypothetical protein
MSDLTQAFLQGAPKAKGNHTVTVDPSGAVLYLLHGHVIARWAPDEGTFEMRHAGHPSVTTAKALNALLRACDWLPFELKSWRLTDVRTGMSLPFPSNGSALTIARGGFGGNWCAVNMPVNEGSLAPTMGGK